MDFKSVDEYSTEGLKRIIEATRAFQSLPPAGPLWDLQKSYPEFSRAMKNCRTRILPIMKTLLEHAKISTTDFKKRDLEEKFEFIVDSNDDILERIGSALDEAAGLFKRNEILPVNQNTPISTQSKFPSTSNQNQNKNAWGNRKIDYRDSSAMSKVITNNPPVILKRPREEVIEDENRPTKKKLLTNITNTNAVVEEAAIIIETTGANRPIKKAIHRLRVTEKPQIHFKIPIDNSLSPFVPKLKEKPNSFKPLSILPEYNSKNEEFYGHPYNVELNRWEPDDVFLTTVEPQLPLPLQELPFIFISTPEELENLLKELREVNEVGVDLEHHSYRTFLGLTCTIQISTRSNDYVIDALALREELSCLNEVFTNPKVMKVIHGSQSDLEWLQRDFGVYIVGLFDTHIAAKHLGLPFLSLQYLLQQYCEINVDKTYQLADWRLRPLPVDMVEYSRQDTHFLLYLYDVLKNQLIENGNQFKNLLMAVYDRSKMLCLRRYEKPSNNPQLALRKTRRQLNNRQLYAFTHLYKWRDGLAREKDESLGFILPNHMLLMIAESLPKEMTGILACCDPVPTMVQSYLGDLHRIILQARDLPLHEEKVQLGTTEKRKKLKNWVVMLNSMHDVNLTDLNEMNQEEDEEHEDKSLNGPGRQRTASKTFFPEAWDSTSIDITNVKIKAEPTSKIFGPRLLTKSKGLIKNTPSSAFERYQLSNEIIEMLKDPKKKEELDLQDPLVRVVYDTLLGDVDSSKVDEESDEEDKVPVHVRKVLPDSEFVPFNPMARKLNTFEPPKKKTKRGNKHEEWNDGDQYETAEQTRQNFLEARAAEEEEDEDEDDEEQEDPMDEDEEDNDGSFEKASEFMKVPTSNSNKKSSKRKNRSKKLENFKLKKLMRLQQKKKYELAALEQEERYNQEKYTKRDGSREGSAEVDVIKVVNINPTKGSKSKSKGNNNKKKWGKKNARHDEDDGDVICIDDSPPPTPPTARLRVAPPREKSPPPTCSPPPEKVFNPLSSFMEKGKVRGVSNYSYEGLGQLKKRARPIAPPPAPAAANVINPNFIRPPNVGPMPPTGIIPAVAVMPGPFPLPVPPPHVQQMNNGRGRGGGFGLPRFLNQFRHTEGKSMTFRK